MIRIRQTITAGPFTGGRGFCTARFCMAGKLNDQGLCKAHAKPREVFVVEKKTIFRWKHVVGFPSVDMAEEFVMNYGKDGVVSVWHKDETGYFKYTQK